jgi:hypothetical protein
MTPQHLLALSVLAGSPDGCSEAMLRSRGFTVDAMADLIHAKLVSAVIERLIDGEETIDVMRLRITEAGRRFRGSGLPSVMRDAMRK